MASNKTSLCVGDNVRVEHAYAKTLSETVYVITKMNYEPTGYRCMIRQDGVAPNGKPYASQEFDVSLLVKSGPSPMDVLLGT